MSGELTLTTADYNINRVSNPNKIKPIDLELLSQNFKLGNGFDKIKYTKKEKDIEEVYNRPPVGPIPEGFKCSFCFQVGPKDHKVNCLRPENSSLFLTYGGFLELLGDLDFQPEDLPEFDEARKSKSAKKAFLEKYFETAFDKENPRDLKEDTISSINYTQVVPVKGVTSLSLGGSFSNVVFINYSHGKDSNSNIRVYPSGFIDIKGAPIEKSVNEKMIKELIKRINSTPSDTINIPRFNSVLSQSGVNVVVTEYKEIPSISFYTIIKAQFSLGINEENQVVLADLNELFLEKFKKSKNSFTLKETKLSTDAVSKQGYRVKESLIYKFETPTGKMTLQISRFGNIQFTLSNDKQTDIQTNKSQMEKIKDLFMSINKKEYTSINLEKKVKIYSKTETTVSGLVPPKSKGQLVGSEVCRKNTAGVSTRPEPYIWSGECPDKNYVVNPVGTQGGDIKVKINGNEEQLFYPCCKKLTKIYKQEYENYLKFGFPPKNTNNPLLPGVLYDPLSGVINPKDLTIGNTTKVKTEDSSWESPVFIDVKLLKELKVNKKIFYDVLNVETNEKMRVSRENIIRDTRRFRGLNDLSKEELIEVLDKTDMLI